MMTSKIKIVFLSSFCLLFLPMQAGTNLQFFYDFGSEGTACANQRTNRLTATLELFYPDPWGNTFAFVDFDFGINAADRHKAPFMAYTEIARCLNFWQNSAVKDLSIQIEYNGGLGLYLHPDGTRGIALHHAALAGLNYCLHTADYKNVFNLELLYKYIADPLNGNGIDNKVPLQFTFVWKCEDFCTAPGLTFCGFADIWGQKMDYGQSFIFISEPQLWYCVGQWFKCPNLHIGTEIEFSYNFAGRGFMCNPCLGIKWNFD